MVGLSLEILRSLGGEIDRHGELEGLQGPDDLVICPHDDERVAVKNEMDAEAQLEDDGDTRPVSGGHRGRGNKSGRGKQPTARATREVRH